MVSESAAHRRRCPRPHSRRVRNLSLERLQQARAQRRGQLHNQPLNGQVGARAVVILNNTFVERLQQVSVNGTKTDDGSPRTISGGEDGSVLASKTDFLPAQHVSKLLLRSVDGAKAEKEEEIPDLLSTVGDLANSIMFPDLAPAE